MPPAVLVVVGACPAALLVAVFEELGVDNVPVVVVGPVPANVPLVDWSLIEDVPEPTVVVCACASAMRLNENAAVTARSLRAMFVSFSARRKIA